MPESHKYDICMTGWTYFRKIVILKHIRVRVNLTVDKKINIILYVVFTISVSDFIGL